MLMAASSLNAEQQRAIDLILAGRNVFLTGQAGTGKSYVIKQVIEMLTARGGCLVGVTSTTGVSALLVGGTTIHRWAGIKLGELDAQGLYERASKNGFARKNWKQTSLLIIDEVSMLTPDLLEKLDYIGKRMRHCDKPFGGIQVVLTGDFCQLPPVKTDVFCFQTPLWHDLIQEVVWLKQIMRQPDPRFQKLLSEVRLGVVTDETRELLSARVGVSVNGNGIEPTKVYPHRKTVDDINNLKLDEILNEGNHSRRFKAQDAVKCKHAVDNEKAKQYLAALNKVCQARPVLDLAHGAQVMLIHNLDIEAGLVNGSRGVVVRFEEFRPVVRFMNGLELIVRSHEWEMKASEDVVVVRRQIPLILAWACTIHKTQGSTLDCAEVDLGDTLFEFGQFYTALSRVKSLECLSISSLSFDAVKVHPEAEKFYANLK